MPAYDVARGTHRAERLLEADVSDRTTIEEVAQRAVTGDAKRWTRSCEQYNPTSMPWLSGCCGTARCGRRDPGDPRPSRHSALWLDSAALEDVGLPRRGQPPSGQEEKAVERMDLNFVALVGRLGGGARFRWPGENERSILIEEVKIGCRWRCSNALTGRTGRLHRGEISAFQGRRPRGARFERVCCACDSSVHETRSSRLRVRTVASI